MLEKTVGLVGLVALLVPQAAAQRGGGVAGQDSSNSVWHLLSSKYDKNKDGKITAKEYLRGEAKFKAFDRDGDGELTAKDFEGGGRGRRGGGRGNRGGGGRRGAGGFGGRMNPAQMAERILKGAMARTVDANEDGKVTQEEWKSFLVTNSKDDVFEMDKLLGNRGGGRGGRGGMGNRFTDMLVEAFDKDQDGDVTIKELSPWFAKLDANKDGTLAGEEISTGRGNRRGGNRGAGNRQNAPGVPVVGQVAPDFNLPYIKNTMESVKLSSFAGKKPVALIFGSYT